MIDDQITARLYVFIRENIKGGCKKFSIGDKCECALCDLDRLLDASNQNTAMNHSELIARLHGLTGTLKSGAWSTIAEAADALQAMERVPMPQEHIDEEWFHICELKTNGLQKARLFARIVEAHHGITPPESKG